MNCTSVAVSMEESEGCKILRVGGELTVLGIQPLRQALLDALDSGCKVVLDLEKVEEIDLCGLQIIFSGQLTFRKRGLSLLAINIPEGVRTVARWAGYGGDNSIVSDRPDGMGL